MNNPANIPIVDITVFGDASNIDNYARNAFEWAKREIVPNSPIYCPCLRKDIYISNNNIMQFSFDRYSFRFHKN